MRTLGRSRQKDIGRNLTACGRAAKGEAVFAENCVACHGEGGIGMKELGAPALNDAIWLYGGAKANIVSQIQAPRHGVMPAFGSRVDETTIKMLAVYVHSLGGGQ